MTLLSVDIDGMFNPGYSLQRPPPTLQALPPPDAIAFLESEYAAVVAEIRLRIEHEHSLFALKFTLTGAILYLKRGQARRDLRAENRLTGQVLPEQCDSVNPHGGNA